MDLVLSQTDLVKIIARAYAEGARQTLETLGELKSSYSQREAEKVYGKTRFQNWLKAGKIYPMNRSEQGGANRKKSFLVADCEKLLTAEQFKIKVKN